MQKFKKVAAVVLAMSMVFGSSVAAFAADSGSGSSTGAGTSEGHLERKVIDVVLPSVAEESTPFAYTVDLERLIQDTKHAKYENATFPNKEDDTGVYFLNKGEAENDYEEVSSPDVANIGTYYEKTTTTTTSYKPAEGDDIDASTTYYTKDGDVYTAVATASKDDIATYYVVDSTETKDNFTLTEDKELKAGTTYYTKKATVEYKNTSETLKVTSRSSADVKVTVEVTAKAGGTKDVPLVTEELAAGEKDAKLYLALKLDAKTTPIEAGKTVSDNVTINGLPGNFEATYKNGQYEYSVKEVKEGEVNNLVDWGTASFSLSGAASKVESAEGLTAPELTVTWRYEDPNAEPAADDNAGTTDPDPEPETSLTPGSASSTTGIDFEITFAKGTAASYTFANLPDGVTLKSVTQGTTATNITGATSNVTISENKLNIASGMWGSASSGDKRYLKVTTSDDEVTYVVEVTIS